jgi:hypothetical protein
MIGGLCIFSPDETAASGLPWLALSPFELATANYRRARFEMSRWAGICAATEDAHGPAIWEAGHPDDIEKLRRVKHWVRLTERAAEELTDAFGAEPPWGRA